METSSQLHRDPVRAALIALALLYALLAGLKTVADPDLGWQLATGRYIVKHHSIPSVDVLSHTARGNEWIYPAFSGVILYAVSRLGGWDALSWLNVLACLAAVALLVLRGGRLTALLAMLAVPVISYATEARSEPFTTILFTATLGLLWQHYQGTRVHLWLLPAFMALWVNFHTGFAAGLALLGGYILLELLELPFAAGRSAAIARLRRAVPWCALAALATIVNPWGYRIYIALERQNEVSDLHKAFIGWWSSVKLNSEALTQFLDLRDSGSGYWWLLLVAACAVAVTIFRKRLGPAVLLAGGAYLSLEHIRFQALFAILVVTIAGRLPRAIADGEECSSPAGAGAAPGWMQDLRGFAARRESQLALLAAAALLVGFRGFDLVSDRHYVLQGQLSLFGTGPSWWYPERAAEFLLREKIPGNMFNDFDLGGYLAWRIGPEYSVYADGRYIPFGTDLLLRNNRLMASPPDSPDWTAEVDARHINFAVFSLSRYGQLERAPLAAFCSSRNWKPVYLDEVSAIFLRVRPENEPWLRRLTLDCRSALFAAPDVPTDSPWGRAELYEFYSNAGSVFYVLSRDAEAIAALDHAAELFPGDSNLHLIRGQFFEATGRPGEAELEYRASLELRRSDRAWYALGLLYATEHRYSEAAECMAKSAELSINDYDRYRVLGQIYLAMNAPQRALEAFDQAERRSPFERGASAIGVDFHASLAEDRARAWRAEGELARAAAYAEQAVHLTPESATRWQLLADLYTAQGRSDAAAQARQHAALAGPQ